jgi:hypothetical protein
MKILNIKPSAVHPIVSHHYTTPNENTILAHIIYTIRNLQLLTPATKQTISKMTCEDKMQIIMTYNDIIESFSDLIMMSETEE